MPIYLVLIKANNKISATLIKKKDIFDIKINIPNFT